MSAALGGVLSGAAPVLAGVFEGGLIISDFCLASSAFLSASLTGAAMVEAGAVDEEFVEGFIASEFCRCSSAFLAASWA